MDDPATGREPHPVRPFREAENSQVYLPVSL